MESNGSEWFWSKFTIYNSFKFICFRWYQFGIYIYVAEGFNGTTSVKDNISPLEFELFQNYPNPFNPTKTIQFTIPVADKITLKAYNTLGEEVRTLIDGEIVEAGNHKIIFNASDLSSGVYIYRLQSSTKVISKKLVLLK